MTDDKELRAALLWRLGHLIERDGASDDIRDAYRAVVDAALAASATDEGPSFIGQRLAVPDPLPASVTDEREPSGPCIECGWYPDIWPEDRKMRQQKRDDHDRHLLAASATDEGVCLRHRMVGFISAVPGCAACRAAALRSEGGDR